MAEHQNLAQRQWQEGKWVTRLHKPLPSSMPSLNAAFPAFLSDSIFITAKGTGRYKMAITCTGKWLCFQLGKCSCSWAGSEIDSSLPRPDSCSPSFQRAALLQSISLSREVLWTYLSAYQQKKILLNWFFMCIILEKKQSVGIMLYNVPCYLRLW